MSKKQFLLIRLFLLSFSFLMSFTACNRAVPQETVEWNWPKQMHIAAPGRSGLAKYVSWASILEADTGMAVRVIPESNHGLAMENVKSGKMLLSSGSKSVLSNIIEALEDQATVDNGGFQPRIVWGHDLANSGFFVRGDSEIKTIYDIKEGCKFSVWNMNESTLNPYRALLAWIQVDEDSIEWVNAGSFDAAMRAISEGRADLAFGFPASPITSELASAPHGIEFLDLNSDEDPEGAKRWQALSPLYSFGPIESGIDEAMGHWGSVGYIFNITSETTDAELIYHLAKWFDEHFEDYGDKYRTNRYMSRDHLMDAINTTFIPLHPGLIKYLREQGLWTDAHSLRQEENVRLLNVYEEAYGEAKSLAEEKDIEISPLNDEWLSLWRHYKVEHNIPKMGQHTSLTESGVPVFNEPEWND